VRGIDISLFGRRKKVVAPRLVYESLCFKCFLAFRLVSFRSFALNFISPLAKHVVLSIHLFLHPLQLLFLFPGGKLEKLVSFRDLLAESWPNSLHCIPTLPARIVIVGYAKKKCGSSESHSSKDRPQTLADGRAGGRVGHYRVPQG